MMVTKQGKTLHLRLTREVDTVMRKFISRRGDVRTIILGMFEKMDLGSVDLPKMEFEHRRGSPKATTILNFPHKYHLSLKRLSQERECSMNALVNGGIKAYTSVLKRGRRERQSI
jgi:hypothetical protein